VTGPEETWLVTGASGFFGFNFPISTRAKNLVALTRNGEVPAGYHSAVRADLARPLELHSAIKEIKPNYVVHAAALASPEECERNPNLAFAVNAIATEALAEAAADTGSKLIYLSTDAVFSGLIGNYSEFDPTDPFSVYGESKLAGENAVMALDHNSLIIRTNFFGWSPTRKRSILEFFVNNLEAGTPIRGYTDFVVSSIYVPHLVQHIEHLKDQSGTWHVASRDALTKYEFGLQVAEVFGFDSDLMTPVTGQGEVSRSRNISLNTAKLQNFLADIDAPKLSSQREGLVQARDDRPASHANV